MNKWKVGQVWKNRHGHLMMVTHVYECGWADICMVHPYKSRPHTQAEVPWDWEIFTEAT